MAKSAVRSRPNAAQGREAKAGDTEALQREIAALRAQLGERGPDPDAATEEYPKTLYRLLPKPTLRWPNGYEPRRADTPEAEARLRDDGFTDYAEVAEQLHLAEAASA